MTQLDSRSSAFSLLLQQERQLEEEDAYFNLEDSFEYDMDCRDQLSEDEFECESESILRPTLYRAFYPVIQTQSKNKNHDDDDDDDLAMANCYAVSDKKKIERAPYPRMVYVKCKRTDCGNKGITLNPYYDHVHYHTTLCTKHDCNHDDDKCVIVTSVNNL